ncbi:hypothetical protein Nwi_1602 [Nitrobacter winogradskyi Nb-255]|uniref:Uncharacterized protein n=1 Tax=Nitrobacter winogradskyi (strain ATCC 25391 / DSM 10237 / CIP 104748 / NCIMB 11846 / Nb-255) TaxID=323098 RepID=Q3SS78_NITWN|nr:hypothetical protein Nwi_1602 [Nitrobacter winogradskyi Nb-255]
MPANAAVGANVAVPSDAAAIAANAILRNIELSPHDGDAEASAVNISSGWSDVAPGEQVQCVGGYGMDSNRSVMQITELVIARRIAEGGTVRCPMRLPSLTGADISAQFLRPLNQGRHHGD